MAHKEYCLMKGKGDPPAFTETGAPQEPLPSLLSLEGAFHQVGAVLRHLFIEETMSF